MKQRIAIFGLGYVGAVTSACLSRDGHQVIGVDVDPEKVSAVNRGESPVLEPFVSDLIRQSVVGKRLRATTSANEAISGSDIAVIAVGTPSDSRGDADLGAVIGVIESIGQALAGSSQEYVVVVRSTLLPFLVENAVARALTVALGEPIGKRVHLCTNPEFLREATAVKDYDNPPFIVVGAESDSAANAVLSLYQSVDALKIVTDLRTAGLVKYACNAFHAVKIAFANEVGVLAKSMNADGSKVMDIVCQDTQLNVSRAYLRPGFAFGGSCLPKDLRAITRFADREAVPAPLLAAVIASNDALLDRGCRFIQQRAGNCRRLGLLGLSFKSGTDDLRESPQVRLAETLIGRGYDIRIYDPDVEMSLLRGQNKQYMMEHLPHLAALLQSDASSVCQHAELLVIGTDVADKVSWQNMFSGPVVDLRRDLVRAGHNQLETTDTDLLSHV